MKRYLESQVRSDLQEKMVFLGCARQAGKTTLALQLSKTYAYLNWDNLEDRARILSYQLPKEKFLIFDEIHKYRLWRTYLKGLYDKNKNTKQFLITGSARLDYYRYGGDSLQGRYNYLRLYPLSYAELRGGKNTIRDLLKLGPFPEPFLGGSEVKARRWSIQYRSRILQEDIASVENISDLSRMELLNARLPDLVGSPLSLNSLREDLEVSHKTVSRWVDILDRCFALFRISPFGSPLIKAVKKEQKHYHYDWTQIQKPGPRFENLVALHLLKWVHFQYDTKGINMELLYFRDEESREVDFVVTTDKIPTLIVECKLGESNVSPHLIYFKKKFPECEAWQVHLGQDDFENQYGIRLAPCERLLEKLV